MKAEEKKSLFLSNLFQHLDGVALIPVIIALEERQILSKFQNCNIFDLSAKHNANTGYLNVALRLLCSQGILKQRITHNHTIISNENIEEHLNDKIHSAYIEVRETNFKALKFYQKFGFIEYNIRENYYSSPTENAILMQYKFQSE